MFVRAEVELNITRKNIWQVLSPAIVVGLVALFFIILEMSIPFTSAVADVYPAYALYSLFYVVLIASYIGCSLCLHAALPCSTQRDIKAPPVFLYKVMLFSCWVSIVGICFLVIDRSLYQGVDFMNDNFVEIRSRLNVERGGGGGVSSIFSVLGNLMQFWYFFSLVFLIYYYEFFLPGQRRILVVLMLVILLTGSYILGGRSLVAVLVVSAMSVVLARRSSGRIISYKLFSANFLLKVFIVAGFCLSLVMYVFYMRASVGGNESASYLDKFVYHLHGKEVQGYEVCGEGLYCDFKNYLQLTALYAVHVFWVLAESIQYVPTEAGGSALWGGILELYSKVGGPSGAGNYPYAGLFNSLPGSIYYEYGWLGVIVGSLYCGVVFSLINFLLLRSSGVFKVIFYVVLLDTLLVSPVLSSLNVIMFIFVIVSLLSVAFIYVFLCS